jgi:glycosyltransferase involved in cell wall biosynthesis
MRVLLISGEFPPMQGGVADCTNEIARALTVLGVEVGVLTSARVAGDDCIHRLPFEIFPTIERWNWSSLQTIARNVREFSPDIVHVQFQTASFGMHPAIYFLPRFLSFWSRARVKRLTTFHDLLVPYLFPKAALLRTWITRELARANDGVIATNEEDYQELGRWRLPHISLIPIGSNISPTRPPNYQRSAQRAQFGITEDETLLCYFGFLNESKGGETLIRALALLTNTRLLMVGGQTGASDPTNAVYLRRVKELIGALGLSSHVIWTDFIPPESVTANFLASDICVMPYRDGASFRRGTLMAALAHGMSIVTTSRAPDAKSNRRVASGGSASQLPSIRDGENCILVPPDDPRTLADAIQRAAASPELRAKISAGALDLAQHFTWGKIASRHLELYQQMLEE